MGGGVRSRAWGGGGGGGKREISLILSQGVEGWHRHKYPHRATGSTRSARPRLSLGERDVIVTIPLLWVDFAPAEELNGEIVKKSTIYFLAIAVRCVEI